VKSGLTNNKLLLKFATFSVIESLRSNPELYNFISYNISNNTYGYNYLSLMSGQQQHQQSFSDRYTALISEEAEKLYNKLTTKLTNEVIVVAAIRASSLPLLPFNNMQNLIHKKDEIEEPSYNNRPEIYNNNDQQLPNE
jgi:hypothetical protein